MVDVWSHELVNKLVEVEAFINSVWRECTQVKDEFLFDKLFCVGTTTMTNMCLHV